MGRSKRQQKTPHSSPQMLSGLAAAEYSPARSFDWWPTLQARYEVDAWSLETIWRRARALYANSPEIQMAVKSVVSLCGVLMPKAQTADEEWNKLARDAFLRRVNNPNLYDRAGVLNWKRAQHWIERRAVIDGDCFTVLTTNYDGGPACAFYTAPQVQGDAENLFCGVRMSKDNRRLAYRLTDGKTEVEIPSQSVVPYMHNIEPGRPRGVSELSPVITTARDMEEINAYNKQSVKLAASFAMVESQDMGSSPASSIFSAKPDTPLTVSGVKAVTLAPGRKLDLLTDHRPSTETRNFIKDMIRSLAFAFGLDPEILYYVLDMGSAGTRLSLVKLREWVADRMLDREEWCNKQWRYFLASEMQAGRLRRCRDPHWGNVAWVNRPDKTIDKGRDGATQINLVREGLADADRWCLETEGMTFEELVERKIHAMAHAKQMAEEANLTLEQILPGALGNTQTAAAAPPPGKQNANPPPPNDNDPET